MPLPLAWKREREREEDERSVGWSACGDVEGKKYDLCRMLSFSLSLVFSLSLFRFLNAPQNNHTHPS